MTNSYYSQTVRCEYCGHTWIIISDKKITPIQMVNWVKIFIVEHLQVEFDQLRKKYEEE